MRRRKKIMEECTPNQELLMEVLLDIRDLQKAILNGLKVYQKEEKE